MVNHHLTKSRATHLRRAIHQFCKIGEYSALAPYSGTRQDLPPFSIFEGRGGLFAGLNRIALRRASITQSTLEELKIITRWFYQEKTTVAVIKERILEQRLTSPEVQRFISFVETSQRGVSRRSIQDGREKGESL
jgi:UDP-N-acetylglucosamine acyltransferase